MERIVEQRLRDNFPAKAIQWGECSWRVFWYLRSGLRLIGIWPYLTIFYHSWPINVGAVGDVGIVANLTNGNIDVEVVGTLQQPIGSCLNVLDILLTSPQAIVSSIILPERNSTEATQDNQMTLIKSVMKIMGIRDMKNLSKNASLADIGMDSLMSVEIKQMMEREFDVVFSAQQVRSITIGKLDKMSTTTSDDIDWFCMESPRFMTELFVTSSKTIHEV